MISIELFEPFLGTAFGYFEKLAILGEKTLVVDLSPLDPTLMVAGEAIAAPLAIVKFMALIFLAFPMAAVMKMLPGRNLKHLFSTAGGFFMLQWLFGADWIHAMVSCTVTYLICAVVRGRSMPVIAFVWVMGYMTVSHAYRMYVSYHSGIFDYTGTQMVLTMKLTSFAYNLYDGTIDKKKVLETEHTDKRLARVYSDRKKYAITKLPNILEFFGYAFCFTCLMAGPAFEYRDYINIIDGTAYKRKTKDGKEEEVVPSAFLPAIKNLIISVVCLGTHLFLSGYVSSSQLFKADWIAVTPWFKRVPYFWLTELMERNKYYFVWKAAEGASVLAGFGFEGYDSNGSVIGWGGVGNVDILEVEFAPNLQSMVRSWNKRTQGWLERYTYCRLGNSLVATYFVSALWHGLYPGYFMFFLSVPILTSIERLVRVKINPRVIPGYDGRDNATAPKSIVTTIYWGLCMVGTSLGLNYIAQVFAQQTQTGERALAIWGSYYHIPHLVFVAIYLLLSALPTPRSKDADEKKKK